VGEKLVGEQPQFAPAGNGLGAAGDAKFAVDVVEVLFDRADGDNQFVGKLAVRKPRGNQAQDFAFTFTERCIRN